MNKFGGRVISQGTQNSWSAHSPDLNLLDFYYWTLAQKEVYSAKLTTVDELINVVERFSEEHRENVLHSVALNVLKRANLCVQQNGGHFYKMYFLLLIIKNPLFLNILVYYFSFFRHYNYEKKITKMFYFKE